MFKSTVFPCSETQRLRRLLATYPPTLELLLRLILYENIRLFLELLGFSKGFVEERISTLDKLLGVSNILYARATPASTLAQDPRVVILDKPTSGLNVRLARLVRCLLCSVAQDRVVIMTTHLMNGAFELGNLVAVLRGGRVVLVAL